MGRRDIKAIRRLELIEAAMSAIHAHGFANLTVSQIAQDAGASTGSIHYYFGGKEALLEATMRHLLSVLKRAVLRRLADQSDPEQRLIAVVAGNFDKALFSSESCSVWTQFWAYAPYDPRLARLQRLNKRRVRSNLIRRTENADAARLRGNRLYRDPVLHGRHLGARRPDRCDAFDGNSTGRRDPVPEAPSTHHRLIQEWACFQTLPM